MALKNGVKTSSNTVTPSSSRSDHNSVKSIQGKNLQIPCKKISETKSTVDRISEDKEKEKKIIDDSLSFKPALFFDGFCWLRNGIKVKVGYKFQGGIYNEKKIVFIDFQDRFYVLDDGVVVHMF